MFGNVSPRLLLRLIVRELLIVDCVFFLSSSLGCPQSVCRIEIESSLVNSSLEPQ
jgi:hypothetical protein